MSGGVDSSVAAALMAEAGHDVVGLSMQLYDQSGGEARPELLHLEDPHAAAGNGAPERHPHNIINFERSRGQVVSNSCRYAAAAPRSHAPLQQRLNSRAGGARRGLRVGAVCKRRHYARVARTTTGRYLLKRGGSRQGSVLIYGSRPRQLDHARFRSAIPQGERRAHARVWGWRGQRDSHRSASSMMGENAASSRDGAARGGTTRDLAARVGSHGGVHRFTVGQRQRARLRPGLPLYVVGSKRRQGRDRRALEALGRCELTQRASTGSRRAAAGPQRSGAHP